MDNKNYKLKLQWYNSDDSSNRYVSHLTVIQFSAGIRYNYTSRYFGTSNLSFHVWGLNIRNNICAFTEVHVETKSTLLIYLCFISQRLLLTKWHTLQKIGTTNQQHERMSDSNNLTAMRDKSKRDILQWIRTSMCFYLSSWNAHQWRKRQEYTMSLFQMDETRAMQLLAW